MATAAEMVTIIRNLIAGSPLEEEVREAAESLRYKSLDQLIKAEAYYLALANLEAAGTPYKIDPVSGMPVSAGELSSFSIGPECSLDYSEDCQW